MMIDMFAAVIRRSSARAFLAVLLAFHAAAAVQAETPPRLVDRLAALRAAVADLSASFGPRYPHGREFLVRIERLEQLAKSASGTEMTAAEEQVDRLAREALVANPLVDGQPIVFVSRHQYAPDHHATETMFQKGEINTGSYRGGGGIRAIDLADGGRIRTIVDAGPSGVVRDPELSFDGKRILFSMRRGREDDYHVYEVDIDGNHLRQLTSGEMVADIDPTYLPNGKIAFSSTRDVKYCQCNRHISPNLFRMEADGRNLLQIGRNNLPELHASLLADGRILYDRWEYVDRQFGPSYGLWTCNPDGTNHALYYGNNSWSPGAVIQARAIPGSEQVVCIFGSCHDRPWGALTIIDRRIGLDGPEPVVRIWPPTAIKLLQGINNFAMSGSSGIDCFKSIWPKYEDPWPLADAAGRGAGKYFLVSRSVEKPAKGDPRMAIFLVDVFGNELLLHDEALGCFDPLPLAPRSKPPVIPDRIDLSKTEGYFYVHDVYQGTGMEQVPRGSIKYLRIVEAPPKRAWSHTYYGIHATQAPAMNFNLTNNKRIVGDVPVEADGSAYFSVPAGKFLYFQALDENKMMVQSMRSGTTVMPGETAGCIGCHEDRLSSWPSTRKTPLRRQPSAPKPWYSPEQDFNYLTEVQPVFDRQCVRCHDYGQDAGKVLNLAGDLGMLFNVSYLELQMKSAVYWTPDKPGQTKLLVKAVHDGPPGVLPAYAWGSHRSRLVDFLRPEHYDVKLSREEFERVVTWIDLNTPYYGSYFAAYAANRYGRSPLAEVEYRRLLTLTDTREPKLMDGDRKADLLVNFTRPELSPILAGFHDIRDPKYVEALAIIRLGKDRLERQPREDMLGPKAVAVLPQDVSRIDRLKKHLELEKARKPGDPLGNLEVKPGNY